MTTDLAQQFFEQQLPARAAQELHRLFETEGSIAFAVGEAAWTFRFAEAEPVQPGFDKAAGLQLWFRPEAFGAFLEGTLDVVGAVKSGAVRARGELVLLERFGRLLQGDQGALGWDVSN